jgi:hypothetical protein
LGDTLKQSAAWPFIFLCGLQRIAGRSLSIIVLLPVFPLRSFSALLSLLGFVIGHDGARAQHQAYQALALEQLTKTATATDR